MVNTYLDMRTYLPQEVLTLQPYPLAPPFFLSMFTVNDIDALVVHFLLSNH